MKDINEQLIKKMNEDIRQPIHLELMNRELNKLTDNMNKCFKKEENLRLNSIREEKRFKELIANISHDLRTPLTAIKGYQQLLQNGKLSEDQQNKLQIAQKHTEELGHLIEHFFEYSYLVQAEPKLNRIKLNLSNFVAESLAASISNFEKRQIQVTFEESLPVYAMVDEEMMARILRNLVRNCIEHSKGNVIVQVLGGDKAIILFKNSVERETELDVERLFERFYTNDRARSKTTGLGLSIVKLLAEQMGGCVSAHLQCNELSIRVELPIT